MEIVNVPFCNSCPLRGESRIVPRAVGLSAKVEEVLKITQLFRVFPEFQSEEEAVDSFPEPRV
jgi:hypothetical protein